MSSLFSRALRTLGAAACGLVMLSGCDATPDTAMLTLNVDPMAGGSALQAGQPFQVDGRTGQLDVARMYLSDIVLLHEDGREVSLTADPITVRARQLDDTEIQHTVTDRYVLVRGDAGRTSVSLGEVPSGTYTGVRFMLGVDGLDNRIAMEDAPASHPLANQTPSMHWNWNAGYVFLRMDGLLDINGDGTPDPAVGDPGSADSGQWRLHLGQTANATSVELTQDFEIEGGEMESLDLEVDFAEFVDGTNYDLPERRFCMTGGCADVVNVAKANVASAFSLR
ncbi:MAG: MbnP family protein [Bacteroidota bacterium]